MKTKQFICVFFLSIIFVICGANASASQLSPTQLHKLNDADFHNEGIKNWGTKGGTLSSVKLASPINDCSYAIRFKPKNARAKLIYQNDFFMKPGTIYELSFYYRSKGKAPGIYFIAGGKKYTVSLRGAGNWIEKKIEINVPPKKTAGGILHFRYTNRTFTKDSEMLITSVSLTPKGRGEWLSSEKCFERYSDFMRPLGWTISETPEAYIFSRGMIREYFAKKKGVFLREKWASSCYMGRETTGSSYHLKRIPLGFYMYSSKIFSGARRQGVSWKKLYKQAFKDLETHGVTAMLVANTYFPVPEEKGFEFILDLAEKHSIQLILQPSTTYFRVKRTKKNETEVAKSKRSWKGKFIRAKKLFQKFNSHPALLAWCFKEEVAPQEATLLSEYYTLMSKANAQKPIYICNNRVPSSNYPFYPMPQILGFDRYTNKYVSYLGFLASPKRSLQMQAQAVGAYLLNAVSSGRPLIHVGLTANNFCRQILESKNVIIKPKAGWVKNKEKGWNGTVYYYPPKGGMRAQVWTAIASGAKGFMGWFYTTPPTGKAKKLIPNSRKIDSNPVGISCDRFGKEPPEFAETGLAFKEVKNLEKYIINMNRRVLPKATTSSKDALLFTHQMETGGEFILALVNINLGKVDKKTGYYVDAETGRMKGIIPDGPRTIEITLKEKSPVFDLKTGKEIPVKDGKISITLAPGEGTLLLLGNKVAAEQIEKRYSIK